MMDKDVWLATEWAGPFQGARKEDAYDIDLMWIKKDGTIKPVFYGHKALNSLAHTIRLSQTGSNFETFGAMAGKSKDGDSVNIVLANYDEYEFDQLYKDPPSPSQQSKDLPTYKGYKIHCS